MNISKVPVFRKPVIALIATGDELVAVGEVPKEDQIISSNNYGLKTLVETSGGISRLLPIARDTAQELKTVLNLCDNVDLIVTLGGASVGDYDLVHSTAENMGMETSFYKVAMRPGKPLMAGRISGIPILGLPGNPVSALVCGTVFLKPAINAMLGKGNAALSTQNAILDRDLPENGPREHYMRATLKSDNGTQTVEPFDKQDSSLLTVLSKANALLVRPANDKAKIKGCNVKIIPLK
jgi:molybdopterin molybdotransferase